jgi:septal ring factor EnvC (AmiA/AmiB activator)
MVRALQRQMEEQATSVASQSQSVSAARVESAKLQTALTDVARQLAAATGENRDLKSELNAFDPAFFDEIEDLKLSHHTLSSACGRYEELLRTYTARLGLNFQPLR